MNNTHCNTTLTTQISSTEMFRFWRKFSNFRCFLKWRQSISRALLWHSKCWEIMGWYCWTCFNRGNLCTFMFCRRDDAGEGFWWHWIFFTFNSFPSLFISVHVCDCLFRRGLLGCTVSRCFVLYFFFRFCRCLCLFFLEVGSVMITLWWIIAGIETWVLA